MTDFPSNDNSARNIESLEEQAGMKNYVNMASNYLL